MAFQTSELKQAQRGKNKYNWVNVEYQNRAKEDIKK